MVGTGRFDALVEALDRRRDPRLLIQYGAGMAPQLNEGMAFIPQLDDKLAQFNFIITHAGAGSVYALLDRNKVFCVMPNLLRTDDHQQEIANYLRRERLAPVIDIDGGPIDIDILHEQARKFHASRSYQHSAFDFDRFIELYVSKNTR